MTMPEPALPENTKPALITEKTASPVAERGQDPAMMGSRKRVLTSRALEYGLGDRVKCGFGLFWVGCIAVSSVRIQ